VALTNRQIADVFDMVADMLQLKGEIIHRVLSYRRAAESIRELPRDINVVAAEGKLTDMPGIGKTLEDKINELIETGELEFYNKLAAEIPPGVIDIMRIQGVGPKKADLFWKELQITDVEALEKAGKEGKLRGLSGMGAKSEQKVLEGIESMRRQTGRTPLGTALPAAEALLEALRSLPGVVDTQIAGSIRRARPTIGDIDLLVAVDNMEISPSIMEVFVKQPTVSRILGQGDTKSSIELHNGVQVDLRVLPLDCWGTAQQYFTGSQAHNIRIREIALGKGYSLNEHAFSPVDKSGTIIPDAEKVTFSSEEAVYEFLDMQWITPEIRENAGEIERAQARTLPKFIELDDMQADLHMHTTWSDGTLSIREMVELAKSHGRKYIVITDHSRSLGIANGLSIDRLLEQQAEIRKIDAEMNGSIRVFHGTEMEITADGHLDFPDDVLAQLDFVIASVHVSLRQERDVVTQRMINAVNNPHVDLIGHPRGQLIPSREPHDADMDAVFAAAQVSGVAMEINANPARLDLEAQYARRAAELGILLSINTDSHSASDMDLMHYGIRTARRGWVEPASVINTWPVERFLSWVQKRGTASA
jgi:DNA polymerase (family 10)